MFSRSRRSVHGKRHAQGRVRVVRGGTHVARDLQPTKGRGVEVRSVPEGHVGVQFLVAVENPAFGAHILQRPGTSVQEPVGRGEPLPNPYAKRPNPTAVNRLGLEAGLGFCNSAIRDPPLIRRHFTDPTSILFISL